jgi:hypothetical protein
VGAKDLNELPVKHASDDDGDDDIEEVTVKRSGRRTAKPEKKSRAAV